MAKHKQTPKTNQPKAKAPTEQKQISNTNPVKTSLPETNTPKDKWFIIILAALAFLINAATISYDYTLDDPYFTKSNPLVKEGVSSIPAFFTHAAYYGVFKNHDASYRPLLLTSFAIEKQLFGFDPKVSHVVNLLIFCALIIALFQLLRRVFNNASVYIPFFIVLLFELHPIHTEVVASIKSRDEIMALLFTAICTLQSIKYIDTNKMKHLILSGIYFFLALMSKETPVTFVAIVPLTIYFFRNAELKKILVSSVPYLIVAAVYMLMRMNFIESDGEKVKIMVNNNALMAAANYGEKLGTALFIQLKYIILLIFPHPLSYDYSYNEIPIISIANPKALVSLLVIFALLVYALLNFKRKNIFSYCILFYCASVVITSNILVDIGATMAERFVFTASLGFCIAVVFLIAKLMRADIARLNYTNSSKAFYVMGIIALLYSAKTIARDSVWNNNMDLYKSGIETAPNSWRTQYLLGVEYVKMIKDEANPTAKRELFNKAIEQLNNSRDILPGNPDVYLIKGYAFEFIGNRDDSATASYRYAVTIDPGNQKAALNLGAILLKRDSLNEAIPVLQKIIATDSMNTEALADLGAAYGNSGQFNEALKYYHKVIRINPNQPPNVFMSMTNIYHFLGDSANAQHYRQLLNNALNQKK
jgi:tetratricopeptide (TPR) repeat protein